MDKKFTVKLVITNEENQEHISYERSLDEKTTQELIEAFSSITHTWTFLGLDDIR